MGENAIETNPASSPRTCNIAHMKGVCDTPLHIFAQTMNLHVLHRLIKCNEWQSSRDFSQKTVGAYRIRPHVDEDAIETNPAYSSQTYIFAPVEGVCDTPLHMFAQSTNLHVLHRLINCNEWQSSHDFSQKTLGAYRIRPHVGE